MYSIAAMNSSLDNDYGATHGPNSPSTWQLALFVGNPEILEAEGGGVELNSTDDPGYARTTVSHTDFPAAVDGIKTFTVIFPNSTGEWEHSPTHWALIASGESIWDTGELDQEYDITGAGPGPVIQGNIYYGNNVTEEAD